MRDLQSDPLWQAEDLGHPIPDSVHAVSVTMPTWQSVIDYEEERPEVLSALRTGYPRFFCHPTVLALFAEADRRFAAHGETSVVFTSPAAAARAEVYLQRQLGGRAVVRQQPFGQGAETVLLVPQEHRREALRYWRFAGEGVSSRQADALLANRVPEPSEASTLLKGRLGEWSGQPADHVFLFPCGMAAIFAAFRHLHESKPTLRTAQVEFPYVDTLCVQRQFGAGVHLFQGVSALEELRSCLEKEELAAVFAEVPSNPLMRTPDLRALHALCQAKGVPVILDDTIGTVHNVDVYPYADAVTTSLTKYVSGAGDVMAGSLTVKADSPHAEALLGFLRRLDRSEGLFAEDAALLERHSRDFPQRMTRINHTASQLFDYLSRHSGVDELNYPKNRTTPNYEAVLRPGGAWGGLLSIVLKDAAKTSAGFYDALRVSKGPSLGTNFTLACPYTLLAHYTELDWAETCGVSRHLIRISVGLESADDLIDRFEGAFRQLLR